MCILHFYCKIKYESEKGKWWWQRNINQYTCVFDIIHIDMQSVYVRYTVYSYYVRILPLCLFWRICLPVDWLCERMRFQMYLSRHTERTYILLPLNIPPPLSLPVSAHFPPVLHIPDLSPLLRDKRMKMCRRAKAQSNHIIYSTYTVNAPPVHRTYVIRVRGYIEIALWWYHLSMRGYICLLCMIL